MSEISKSVDKLIKMMTKNGRKPEEIVMFLNGLMIGTEILLQEIQKKDK